MSGALEFDIDAPDLKALLERIKQFDPKLATDLRRELRKSGDEIISEQRAILAGPKPGGVARTGTTLRWVHPTGRRPYLARRVVYRLDRDAGDGRGDLRGRISRGLRTRVVTSGKSQGVSIKTTGPRDAGYNLARLWEGRMFRHPVFGDRDAWVYQQGRPYFWDPVKRKFVTVRKRVLDAVEDALQRIQGA